MDYKRAQTGLCQYKTEAKFSGLCVCVSVWGIFYFITIKKNV